MAEGSWPLEFKWIHNNTELTRFSLEYRYLIPSLDRSHAGFYRCIVRNRVGALLQRRTEVQVAFMGSFEEGEHTQSVSQGEGAVVPAPRIRSFPQPQVTWFRDGRKIPPSSRIAITLDNTLVILSTVAPDAGRYYVQAVNDKNGENKTSQPITLSVENIGGPADPIAPTIIIPPRNTSVVTGTSEVTMECVANARPLIKLSISWRKNGVLVTSGLSDFNRRLTILSPLDALPIDPVKMPRYRVLVGGSLQVNGLLPDDTGMFQCFARNLAGEVQTNTYLAVTSIAPNITAGPSDSTVIDGMSVILHCETSGAPRPAITWQKGERVLASGSVQLPRFTLLESGSLLISPSHISDAGTYTCMASNSRGIDEASADLFRLCAVNDVGKGQFSKETERVSLPEEPPSAPPQNIIASGRTNQSIMIQWQPPQESHQNGILRGYIIRYRLTGLPVDYQIKNISSPDVTTLLLEDLIIWTNYEIEVAAYNGAGLGAFSHKVTEWTLQGVPTIAPSNVQTEAVNSTALRFTWTAPNPQFINGINQGYKLLAWEPGKRNEDVAMVTVRPNFQDSVHVGYVTGLKKFTEYYTSVLCFTTPGDGPRSPPRAVRTHEDTPGAVGHLSFTEILDTSLKVSWSEPSEKNGVLTGYRISWEEFNRTNTRVTHYLPNVTLEYRVSNEPEARSLEVPGLNPYTSYRFRMRQVNIVGTSPPSQPSRKIQTLPAPPDMAPANITLRTASETSLWLRWVPLPEWEYNGNAEQVGYRIQYYRAGSQGRWLTHVITDRLEREFTIEDLEEWMEYEVRLQAVNGIGMGPWSQPVRGRTRESIPSSGPTNVSAFATTSSSILVRWFEVPEPDRNGLILGYRVVYKEKDSDGVVHFWTVEGNASHSIQLTGLGKTLDDVPGPPVGILFPEVRTTSVRLIWQSPAQPNGIILAYQITYHLNSTNSNAATVDVLNPSARQYTVTNLKPESVYVFRITAQTRKGWGEAAEALVVTTEKRARPQPTSRPTVPQKDVQARQVLLSWEPGSDGLSPVRYYTVQQRELPDNNWTVHSASVNHEATSYIVSRLKPFTSYQFRVKATNDIGDSEYSEESEATTTLQDAPDEAPAILSVTPHTTTSVLIRWQPPSEEKINGILLGFRIRYRELLYDRLRNYIHSFNSLSSWAELNAPYSMRNLSDPILSQYELDKLSKHKRYEIRMSVYNAVGEGPSSPPQEVFVGEAVPTAPPQNVVIQSATANQLDVVWDPPPVDAQNGDIQGYKIYFWEFQRKNETERLRTLFMPERGVKLKNLTGYTTYMISVAPFNAAGDGPRSTPTRGRTQQAAPSAPSFIHFSELTTTSVNVSWGDPTFPNGIIEGYRLVYEPLTPVEDSSVACADCLHSPSPPGVSKTVTVDVKGTGPLWLKLRDLADGVTYNFRIRAKTFIYGPEVEANITTGPGEGAPGPPGEPFITRYNSGLTIHWTGGDPGRAPITRYVIEARPSDEGLWDILIKDIPKDATSHTFSMDILKQGVSYDFRVIGVNDYGYGSPSLPSPSISAQKVAPFYEEWWFLVVVALVGLIFILLLVFILIIRGQSKKYAKKSESGNNSNCNALTHGDMVSLDEGRFPALELNNRRLSVKNSFCRKNGVYTRSPPRPSPGSLHYSDEDVSTKYNDLIPAESSSLTEKPSEISDSQGSDSEYEVDQSRQKTHSFVNHYISDPTYYNSWRRQQKGVSRPPAYGFSQPEPLVEQESRQHPPPVPPLPPLLPQSSPSPQPQAQGTLFRPKGSRTPTPSLLSSEPPSQHSTLYRPPSSLGCAAQAPTAGFSSFV
uniref:Sidekick homolog 2b (Chicken) n=1 Tax=Nothobranchius kadleci TaxID=1051664 RepID=A0A1A8DKE9_NOTKA